MKGVSTPAYSWREGPSRTGNLEQSNFAPVLFQGPRLAKPDPRKHKET
jgi:hypothetical protein